MMKAVIEPGHGLTFSIQPILDDPTKWRPMVLGHRYELMEEDVRGRYALIGLAQAIYEQSNDAERCLIRGIEHGPPMMPIVNQAWCPFAEEHQPHVQCQECTR